MMIQMKNKYASYSVAASVVRDLPAVEIAGQNVSGAIEAVVFTTSKRLLRLVKNPLTSLSVFLRLPTLVERQRLFCFAH